MFFCFKDGCPIGSQPPQIKKCDPPCTVKHSYCKDTNECACLPGHLKQLSFQMTIEHCIPKSSNYSKNAIDNQSEESS